MRIVYLGELATVKWDSQIHEEDVMEVLPGDQGERVPLKLSWPLHYSGKSKRQEGVVPPQSLFQCSWTGQPLREVQDDVRAAAAEGEPLQAPDTEQQSATGGETSQIADSKNQHQRELLQQ